MVIMIEIELIDLIYIYYVNGYDIRVVHLSFTSKYFDGHLICGARDLPDPSLSFTSAITLRATKCAACDGWPG